MKGIISGIIIIIIIIGQSKSTAPAIVSIKIATTV
jgi:hypothetical protein